MTAVCSCLKRRSTKRLLFFFSRDFRGNEHFVAHCHWLNFWHRASSTSLRYQSWLLISDAVPVRQLQIPVMTVNLWCSAFSTSYRYQSWLLISDAVPVRQATDTSHACSTATDTSHDLISDAVPVQQAIDTSGDWSHEKRLCLDHNNSDLTEWVERKSHPVVNVINFFLLVIWAAEASPFLPTMPRNHSCPY